jgi:hypothetical protein
LTPVDTFYCRRVKPIGASASNGVKNAMLAIHWSDRTCASAVTCLQVHCKREFAEALASGLINGNTFFTISHKRALILDNMGAFAHTRCGVQCCRARACMVPAGVARLASPRVGALVTRAEFFNELGTMMACDIRARVACRSAPEIRA